MNLRSVTRGDAAVALAGLLLLISSFLPFWTVDHCSAAECSKSSWNAEFFPLLPAVTLAGVFGAALVIIGRLLPKEQRVAGLHPGQWGIALSVSSLWSALWSLFGSMGPNADITISHGIGAYLGFLFALVLSALAIAAPRIAALNAPLLPEPKPKPTPAPAGGFGAGAAAGAPGGYGYGGGGFQQQPPQQQGYAQQAPQGAQAAQAPQAAAAGQPWSSPAPAPEPSRSEPSRPEPSRPEPSRPEPAPVPEPARSAFAPFWFAVPAQRKLAPEDNPSGAPVGELNPGVWYLAVGERGSALIAQTQEGRRGLLTDTSGIQRG